MEINAQTSSLLQQTQLLSETRNTAAEPNSNNNIASNSSPNTNDTLSISSEAKARLEAEQATDNTMQLQGSGEVNGGRPK